MLPANLTPEYYAAEEAYKKASTAEEKMEALREMLAVIPKHKGTEKLQGDLRRRLSKLREESQKKPQKSTYNPFLIEKQGAGQVVMIGHPNTGKSSLITALTRAKAKVADYPFTTTIPVAGMIPFENILIQLIDTPPYSPEGAPPGLLDAIRRGDLLLLLIDISSDDCLEQIENLLSFLEGKKVIHFSQGEGEDDTDLTGVKLLPFLILATKADHRESEENLEIIAELKPELSLMPVSAAKGIGLEELKRCIFEKLEIIRVYTKAPGSDPDLEEPFVLKKGETVLDLAENIHRDFPERLKNARVWGSAKFDGQSVPREHVLEDGDIVELNIT